MAWLLGLAAVLVLPAAAGEEPVFEARWATTPPVIDGRLDDAVWQQATVIERFRASWLPEGRQTPPTTTRARLLWDHEYLYFSAEMEDTDVFANVTEHDGPIWNCDVFELFFKPAADKPGYFEFQVNAANGQLDMFLPSRGAGGYNRHKSERLFHLESAVQVRGTLNNWADTDEGWSVEGRIPWRDFLPTGGRPVPGEVWMHALCRYDYSAGFEAPALSTTANLTVASFHRHEEYVPLRFIGPDGGRPPARVSWDDSRLRGSPEPPLPFQTVPAFANLRTTQPAMIAIEPGRRSYLLLETKGYTRPRVGRVSRVANDPAVVEPELLLELAEAVYDICFHPNFAENGYLYIGANGPFGKGRYDFNTRVLRYTMDRRTGRIDPASRLVIIEWQSQGHNGAALTFGKDGMLYVTSGDGTSDSDEWDAGQDLTRLLAKVLRLDVDRPAPGQAYSVPPDNPFLTTEGARPETWAYGLRNPWRMTMDSETGELWVGENGQDRWEYARIVRRGENYGWPIVEGSHDFHLHRKRGPTPITKPLVEHPHNEFRSLTGGIVYRGSKFTDLVGCYIYGDYSTGQIWAAQHKDGKLTRHEFLANTTLSIAAFCEGLDGEILVVDYLGHAIHQLERAPPTAPAHPFPTRLSDTGLFTDTRTLQPHPALLPYEVNAPGWHDGAVATRQIALPGTGRMEVTEQRGWNFPNGAAVVQTLSVGDQRIESRVLLRQQNEWAPYTYAWNAAQTEAELVPPEGRDVTLASGQPWRIPGRQECMACHSRASNFVLGLSTVQLNRGGQLEDWERAGVLSDRFAPRALAEWRTELAAREPDGAMRQTLLALITPHPRHRQPPADSPLLSRAPATLPRLVDPRDTSATLNDRARSYLHSNCSHCHALNAGGNSLLRLASDLAEGDMNILNALPMHTQFGIADARLVAPGAPERSLLAYRTVLRGPGQMPPVGTLVPDGEGATLLAQWIAALPVPPHGSSATNP